MPTSGSGAATCSTSSAASPASARKWRQIALESLIDYPALQFKTAVVATAKQLIDVHTGEGVLNDHLAHLRASSNNTRRSSCPPCARRASSTASISFTGHQRAALSARADRDGAAAGHRAGWPGARQFPPRSANSPPPSRSRCWAMPSCAARCPIRTTATARAWSGSRVVRRHCSALARTASRPPWAACRIDLDFAHDEFRGRSDHDHVHPAHGLACGRLDRRVFRRRHGGCAQGPRAHRQAARGDQSRQFGAGAEGRGHRRAQGHHARSRARARAAAGRCRSN